MVELVNEIIQLNVSSSDAKIEQLIRGLWTERLYDATTAIQRCMSEDVRYRVLGGQASMPGPWLFNGRDAMIEAIGGIDRSIAFLDFRIVDLIVDGAEAALRWHATLRHRISGETAELSVFDLITVRDGQITDYTEFLDTESFHRLMLGEPQSELARRGNQTGAHAFDLTVMGRQSLGSDVRAQRLELLQAFWQDRLVRGGSALQRVGTDDCAVHLIGDPAAVPFARSHRGLEAANALMDQFDMEFEFLNVEVDKVLIGASGAAMLWSADVRHRGTSASGRLESFDHILFRGDRIAAITGFFDTAEAARWIEG